MEGVNPNPTHDRMTGSGQRWRQDVIKTHFFVQPNTGLWRKGRRKSQESAAVRKVHIDTGPREQYLDNC